MLDDRGNLPVTADDPPVPVRLRHPRGQHGRGGRFPLVRPHQFRNGLTAQERDVARQQQQRSARAFQLGLGLQQGMPRPELRFLQSKPKAGPPAQRLPDGVRLVADHHDAVYRRDGIGSPQDVLNQRQASHSMQHFRQRRLHSRPLAGRKDDDVGFGHEELV